MKRGIRQRLAKLETQTRATRDEREDFPGLLFGYDRPRTSFTVAELEAELVEYGYLEGMLERPGVPVSKAFSWYGIAYLALELDTTVEQVTAALEELRARHHQAH